MRSTAFREGDTVHLRWSGPEAFEVVSGPDPGPKAFPMYTVRDASGEEFRVLRLLMAKVNLSQRLEDANRKQLSLPV